MSNYGVYIAGPMRGRAQLNFGAFIAAAEELTARGYHVYCPAAYDIAKGYDPRVDETPPPGWDLGDSLLWGAWVIVREARATVMLPDWQASEGALFEFHLTRAVGKPTPSLAAALLSGPPPH